VLVNFIQSCLLHWIVVLPLLALLAVVISQPLGQPVARTAALRAIVVAAPLVPLLLALAWTSGLQRLERRERWGSSAWWLAAFLVAPLAWLIPLVRLPGAAVSAAITGAPVLLPTVALSLLALIAVIGLMRAAGRTNLIAAAEESRTYARINALGLMAILAPDVTMRIRRQEALARRNARFRLPNGRGAGALAARSVLLSMRRPGALLGLFLWGVAAATGAGWLVLSRPPLVLWFFWVTFLAIAPPKMLVESFEADAADPYLRQLLPMSNGPLAVVAGIVPVVVLLLGTLVGCAMAAAQFGLPVGAYLAMSGLAACGVAVLLFAQAAAAARVSFFGWRPPYAGWLLVVVLLVGGAMLAVGPIAGGTVGLSLALLLLAWAVSFSSPIVAD
jgi:hypothetical protein